MVILVARKKGIYVPSNLQIDSLIYIGDGSQPSLRLHQPTSSSHHHKNPLVIAKNEPKRLQSSKSVYHLAIQHVRAQDLTNLTCLNPPPWFLMF